MKLSMVCKLDRLVNDRMPKPRLHYFWWHLNETDGPSPNPRQDRQRGSERDR